MARGVPYDSDAGRDYAAAITALMSGAAYAQSARIAEAMGPFAGFETNREPMLRVMRKHRDARQADRRRPTCRSTCCRPRKRVVGRGGRAAASEHGLRNSQISVLAPTGTIAFMMDCDTTGVEPDIALVKYKKLVGGGMIKIVNNTVPLALKRLGYDKEQIRAIVEYIDEHDTIEGAPHLKDEHLPVFDCAFKPAKGSRSIHYMRPPEDAGRRAAVHLGRDLARPSTCPRSRRSRTSCDAYLEGWKLGLKAVAIYRDGCKRSQPLSTQREDAQSTEPREVAAAVAVPLAPAPVVRRASCPTSAGRSPTSSRSTGTRATSRSASTTTASRARSSWSWRRRARRSPA